jgi:hypothetical protein
LSASTPDTYSLSPAATTRAIGGCGCACASWSAEATLRWPSAPARLRTNSMERERARTNISRRSKVTYTMYTDMMARTKTTARAIKPIDAHISVKLMLPMFEVSLSLWGPDRRWSQST